MYYLRARATHSCNIRRRFSILPLPSPEEEHTVFACSACDVHRRIICDSNSYVEYSSTIADACLLHQRISRIAVASQTPVSNSRCACSFKIYTLGMPVVRYMCRVSGILCAAITCQCVCVVFRAKSIFKIGSIKLHVCTCAHVVDGGVWWWWWCARTECVCRCAPLLNTIAQRHGAAPIDERVLYSLYTCILVFWPLVHAYMCSVRALENWLCTLREHKPVGAVSRRVCREYVGALCTLVRWDKHPSIRRWQMPADYSIESNYYAINNSLAITCCVDRVLCRIGENCIEIVVFLWTWQKKPETVPAHCTRG